MNNQLFITTSATVTMISPAVCWWLTVSGAALMLTGYWVLVCPRLYRHGARFPTGLALHRLGRDLRRYRAVLRLTGRPLSAYHALLVVRVFTVIALLAWLAASAAEWLK